jgi:hypothetical protein
MPALCLARFSWLLSAATMFTNAVAGLVILSACASAVMAAADSQTSKTALAQATPSTSACEPVITRNRTGHFQFTRSLGTGLPNPPRPQNGLVIPPQVVTPIFSASEKK